MREQIEDIRLEGAQRLVTPRALKRALPLPPEAADLVLRTRRAVRAALHGKDRERLVVVVGPCSIHDPEAAVVYASGLGQVAAVTEDALVVLMRAYFEKPRTTVGWKGLINDPRLDGSCDIASGLGLARETLLEIHAQGVPCASELLDPILPQYIGDLLSWAAIGARTTESQTHREMASGLSMPVGFKNGTEGNLETARDAMIAAAHPHRFLGIDRDGGAAVIRARGNPDRHLVLRGGVRPNYGPEDVERAAGLVEDLGVARPILVDCSHGNSGKDHKRQAEVCRAVLAQIRAGEQRLLGLAIESNLVPGRQDWVPGRALRRGVSITDACLGWGETEALLFEIADTVRACR